MLDNSGTGNNSGSIHKLLPSGTGTDLEPARPWRDPLPGGLAVPAVLVLALLIGVAILAYSFGVSRGKGTANSERDQFYIGRAQSWQATATAQAITPAVPSPGAGFTTANNIFARVDRIEGDRITVLLLNADNTPSGATLVMITTPQTQTWRNVPTVKAEVKPGDNVLISGERNAAGLLNASSILVLPGGS